MHPKSLNKVIEGMTFTPCNHLEVASADSDDMSVPVTAHIYGVGNELRERKTMLSQFMSTSYVER